MSIKNQISLFRLSVISKSYFGKNGMLCHAYDKPVIFISSLSSVALVLLKIPVLRKIPVLPPDVGKRQGKGILCNMGAA